MLFSLIPSPDEYRRAILGIFRLSSSGVKQLASAPFERCKHLVEHVTSLCRATDEDALIESLKWEMENANSLAEYEKRTTHLDHLQGHDEWKAEFSSIEPDYDPWEITRCMLEMQNAVISQDPVAMERLVRTTLSREMGGLSILRLYKHSWFGTKRLVDEYNNTAVVTIDTLVKTICKSDAPDSVIRTHRQAMERTLEFYGHSALTFSGGALMGMKHIGVAKCLWESEMLPQIISGASAGSIVAAIIGTSTDEEMAHTLDFFPNSNLAVFDPPGTRGRAWAKNRLINYFNGQAFFNPHHLDLVMKEWLKNLTFREAYNKTKRIINICVSGKDPGDRLILNYTTAPNVYIRSAVCASCAVPFVYPDAAVAEKDSVTRKPRSFMRDASQRFVDGSLDHDIPMRKLAEMFNINFFIVSQVNPHVRFALDAEESFTGKQPTTEEPPRPLIDSVKDFVLEEFLHYVQQTIELGCPKWVWRWTSLLHQQYTGHLNILPQIRPQEYLSMMANPTPEFMLQATRDGEKATWPKMCRLKNCVDIELALEQGIRELDERLHFSPEARAARQIEKDARGSSRRGRSAQPNFLRRRSLSNHSSRTDDEGEGQNATLGHRRNASLGSIEFRSHASMALSPLPSLSPQAGVEDRVGEGLMMTAMPRQPRD